jgi:alkanesulfonate monooxygenase SsuD/methylene tetrahydromethanopterin reductase-like flavin-dependent oxidoreductase (luciferase family)
MDVGMMMVFASYGWDDCSDTRVWEEEIRLAQLAADLGFDCLWSAEHHFNDYSFVPDNLQLMSYLTALCPNVDLGTAAVILPWHDPLRVAEQAAVLDMLSKGRLRLGLGRGLARREFAAAADRDPAAAAIFLRRPHLRRGVQRGLDLLRRQARCPYRHIRRPPMGNAAAGHRTRPRAAP